MPVRYPREPLEINTSRFAIAMLEQLPEPLQLIKPFTETDTTT